MNIAELFVRVRADVSDVDRRLKTVEGRLAAVGSAARSTELPMNRMNGALRALATQATHTSGPMGSLLTTLGSFAVGGTVMAGALIGIAAIAKAYELMTAGSRAAKKGSDELIKSLVDQAKAAYEATVAGRDLIKLQAEFELQRAKASSGVGWRTVLGANVIDLLKGTATLDPADAAARDKRIADAETAVRQAGVNLAKTWEESQPKPEKVKAVKDTYMDLRNEIDKVRKAAEEMGQAFWRGLIDAKGEAEDLTASMIELLGFTSKVTANGRHLTFNPLNPDAPGVSASGVDVNIGMTKEMMKQREKMGILVDHGDRNAEMITSAVLQSASIIVGALNIGGGGKGSSLGGAIGGTIGFGLGFAATSFFGGGPVGGAIGSMIGQIGGSLLGGLFDSNKEAINKNTEATNRNTAAMLLYTPGGFRSESYRYHASDPRPLDSMGRAIRANASRGGANPLLVPA